MPLIDGGAIGSAFAYAPLLPPWLAPVI